jgi:hypothetical protein
MPNHFERRQFLRVSAGTLAASLLLHGEVAVSLPEKLDHILLGSSDLQAGIEFVEEHTGVRATFGGVHPGRVKNPLASSLHSLAEPLLVGWAAHPGSVSAFAEKLRAAGIKFEGPTPGARKRPDGQLLKWQTVSLADTASGLLPFFIEWSQDSVHPSVDAPKGCTLLSFAAETPDPETRAATLRTLGLDLPVKKGEHPRLHAVISGPKGTLEVHS